MPYNQISCKTFCRRWFGCSYYNQDTSYSKTLELIFTRVMKDMTFDKTFSDVFINHYNSRAFTGERSIYSEDLESFDSKCSFMAARMSLFMLKNNATLMRDSYLYRGRITGTIGCIITNENKNYTVDFSYCDVKDTYNNIAYHKFNIWAYNMSHSIKNDGMVYVPESNSHYIIKFKASDYTIKRGFLQAVIKNRSYNPGYHCLTCSIKNCKPRLIIRRNI